MRDIGLTASGLLSSKVGGPSVYPPQPAGVTALAYGAYRLQTLRQLIRQQGPTQQEFQFLEEHPIIRPLSDYSLENIIAFRKER